jgi:hypothetical protein
MRDIARHALFMMATGVVASACNGASFTPASQIKSLRVLAVQKAPPYAMPEMSVDVRLLFWDGKADPSNPRALEVCFYDACENPAGDLYYNCFPQLLSKPTKDCPDMIPGSGPDAGTTGEGGVSPHPDPAHQVPHKILDSNIPSTIVAVQPPSGPKYGLKYVFYTVCAGHAQFHAQASSTDLPVQCVDEDGTVLGPDDFVPGYSKLYIYDPSTMRQNLNPIINGLSFGAGSIFNNFDAEDGAVPTAPLCPSADCEIEVKVDVDRASAEIDQGSADLNGNVLHEGLWVDFYANKGDFTKPTRLINDATTGWNDDNATHFKVPAEAGPVHIWAVVHDNRGGVEWAEGKIVVTP